MPPLDQASETHTTSYTSGLFGAGSPTYWSYSFDDWNFESAADADFSYDYGNQDDDYLTASLDFQASYDMAFGITGEARVDLGSIETEVAVTSNAVAINGGISTADAEIETTVAVASPDPEQTYIDIDLIARLDASIYANANFWAYGIGSTDLTLIDEAVSFDLGGDLIDLTLQDVLDSLDARKLFEVDLGFGALQFGFPVFEYEDAVLNDDGSTVVTGATEAFLNVEIDLDTFLPVPPLGFEFEEEILDVIFAKAEVGIFDAKLNVGLSFEQEITFTPETSVTLVSDGGETLAGGLGEDYLFEEGQQEGEGSFTVTATYDADTTVNLITSLVTGAAVDWKLFYAEFGLTIDIPLVYDNFDDPIAFEFTLADGSIDLGLDFSFEIANTSWVIDGESWTEVYTVTYENDVTVASGANFAMTTNQTHGRGNNRANEITGSGAANTIVGRGGDDALFGADGNDRLRGDAGTDVLNGGEGSDFAIYGTSTQGLVVDLSNVSHNTGDAATDTLVSIENIIGSAFNDTLVGDDGDNILLGAGGVNVLVGGLGDDTYDWDYDYALSTGDMLFENAGEGTDTVILNEVYALELWDNFENIRVGANYNLSQTILGNSVANVIVGNTNSNALDGRAGDDSLRGAAGNDNLYGGEGNDDLRGGVGDDYLVGGAGTDILVGGVGRDSFMFRASDSTPADPDIIADFDASQSESIILSVSDFSYFSAGAAAFSGIVGELITVIDGANSFLRGDTNGDLVTDFEVQVLNHHVVFADFFFTS
ncbi:MAG: hypothetical protein V4712_17930 [Pseudomonadota bacterium]